MKIKNKVLSGFLKKINMYGGESVDQAVFDFTTSGLEISAMSPSNIVRVDGVLKTSAFETYNNVGKVGVQNISTIIKVIEKFSEDIELSIQGNLLTIKDANKDMKTELVETQFIEAVKPKKQLEFEDEFALENGVLKDFIDDASVNKEFKINFETVPQGLKISNTGKYKFQRNILSDAKGGVKASFGEPLVNAVKNLNAELLVKVRNDYPMEVVEETEQSKVVVVIAPLLNNQ